MSDVKPVTQEQIEIQIAILKAYIKKKKADRLAVLIEAGDGLSMAVKISYWGTGGDARIEALEDAFIFLKECRDEIK